MPVTAVLSARVAVVQSDLGERVRDVLAGAWRPAPPPLAMPPALLRSVVPLLVRTGAGALAWWRVRDSVWRASRPARDLRQAYRLHALEARLHERRLQDAVELLQAAGVRPLLAKGWAAARLYPQPGLRPYGDLDLWVPVHQQAAAAAALRAARGQRARVDLHAGSPLAGRRWDDVWERSRPVPCGAVEVRVLGPEDHLRLLALHMLRHGVWRPVWLCDIAAALEALPAWFDWDRCLQGERRQAEWVLAAVGLARELLGARAEVRGGPLPRWLPAAVLAQWSRADHYMTTSSLAFAVRHPTRLVRALRLRWPNPIEATVGVGGPFNGLPRLPFQLGECIARTLAFGRRLPRLFRSAPSCAKS